MLQFCDTMFEPFVL